MVAVHVRTKNAKYKVIIRLTTLFTLNIQIILALINTVGDFSESTSGKNLSSIFIIVDIRTIHIYCITDIFIELLSVEINSLLIKEYIPV